MKIIITEEQYSRYLIRRFDCMREYIDKLKSGEVRLPIPIGTFEWGTYNFIFSSMLRGHCGDTRSYFDQKIHDEILKYFGDELYEIYKMNK
jgi:hypothetical protein